MDGDGDGDEHADEPGAGPGALARRDRQMVARDFVVAAFEDGVIDGPLCTTLLHRVSAGQLEPRPQPVATPPRRAVPVPPPPPSATDRTWSPPAVPAAGPPRPPSRPTSRPAAPAPPPPPPPPLAPPRPVAPTRWRAEMARLGAAVSADLAIHGLAYLGVLLLFAGVMGLTVFSLGDVQRELRPIAEGAAPAALLLAGWYLRRRGSRVVGVALEVLGGAVLPLVVLAAWVDGVDLPPDPAPGARVAVLTASLGALTVLYALLAGRRSDHPWRHLVAPVGWLTVAAAGLGAASPVPDGSEIGTPRPWQYAFVLVAIAATAALTAVARRTALARATDEILLAGAAVAEVILLLAAARDGWPTGPLIVAGLALLVIAELQQRWFARARSALQTAALVATVVPLVAAHGFGVGGAIGAVAALAMLERIGRRAATEPAVARVAAQLVLAATLVVGTGGSFTEPWAAVLACATVAAWAHARRIVTPRWWDPRADIVRPREILAAAAPVALGIALLRAWTPAAAVVTLGALVAGVALAVATRRPTDRFYAWWTPVAAALVSVACIAQTDDRVLGMRAAGAALAALAVAVSTRRGVRVWSTAAAIVPSLVLAGAAVPFAPSTIGASLTVLGAVAVLAASVGDRSGPTPTHTVLAGHAMTVLALPVTTSVHDQSLSVALGAVLVAAVSTTYREAWRGAPAVALVGEQMRRLGVAPRFAAVGARAIAPATAALVTPAVVVRTLVRSDVIAVTSPWLGVWIAAAAGLPTAGAWCAARRRPTGPVLAWTALAVALGAILVASTDLHAAACTAAVALGVAVSHRRPVPEARIWIGWAVSGLSATLVARVLGISTADTYLATGAWGAAVLLGTVAVARRRWGRRSLEDLVRSRAGRAPATLGATAAVATQLLATRRSPHEFGRVSVAGALLALLLTLLLSLPPLGGLAWTLAGGAALALAPWDVFARPWSIVAVAAVPVLAATGLATRRRRAGGDADPTRTVPWSTRHDLPALAVAAAFTGLAVASAPRVAQEPLTWAAAGVLAAWIGIWWARVELVAIGVVLVDAAALAAGPSWATGAFAATSALATVLASRRRDDARVAALAVSVGSAAAAWFELTRWATWDRDRAVALTAALGGVVAVLVGAAARRFRLGNDWVVAWGGGATVAVGVAARLQPDPHLDAGPAWAVAVGCTGLAIGAALLGVRAPRWPMREAAALLLAAALGEAAAAATLDSRSVAYGALAVGVACAAIGSPWWRRRGPTPWLRPVGLLGVTALAVANSAGTTLLPRPTVLLVTLLTTAAIATGTGALVRRIPLVHVGALLAAIAWAVHAGTPIDVADVRTVRVFVSALAGGVLVSTTAGLARRRPATRAFLGAWALLGVVMIGGSAAMQPATGDGGHRVGYAIAVGLALLAVATVAAVPLRPDVPLRDACALLAIGVAAELAYAARADATAVAVGGTGLGAVATVAVLWWWRRRGTTPWLRAATLFTGSVLLAANAAAASDLPRRDMFVMTLLATGAAFAAAGLVTARAVATQLGAAFLTAAWIVYASDALAGTVDWFTVPVGLLLLFVVEVGRTDRRRSDRQPVTTPELLVVELLGCGLVVGAALVEIVVRSELFTLVALAGGLALTVWGTLTRVRRRAVVGAAAIVLPIVLAIAVPLVSEIRQAGSTGLWIALAGIGAAAIVAAALIEAGRTRVGRAVERLDRLTTDWE